MNAAVGIGLFNHRIQTIINSILDLLLQLVALLAEGLKYCFGKCIKALYKFLQKFQSTLGKSEMVSLFVPLPHAGSFEMLEAYVKCCEKLDDCSIFDNEVVIAGLKFAWNNYGRSAHLTVMVRSLPLLFLSYYH